jgi:hypothetical protein
MLHRLTPARTEARNFGDVHERIVIAPHHPDRLRWPAHDGTDASARATQTRLWNVFRTLELLPPAFWLRRLHARLAGEALGAAPQTVRISLWKPMPMPPALCVDGARPDAIADVSIETERAVWTLACARHGDTRLLSDDARFAALVDAGAWLAGTRAHYAGTIEDDGAAVSVGAVLGARYSRSSRSAALRSGDPYSPPDAAASAGVLRWGDLAAILRECADSNALSGIEQALARNVVEPLERAGFRSS